MATPALTTDHLLDGRVTLLQPADGYRVAIDPILLAAAVNPRAGQHVLDLGCGTGATSLCLAARRPDISMTGMEKNPDYAALARQNAALSALQDRVTILNGDIASDMATMPLVDHVMVNPPYLRAGSGRASPRQDKAAAHHEQDTCLGDWVAAALARVRHKGSVTFIHMADRLAELLALLQASAGDIQIYPLWPKAGQAARRVIVRARKGVASPTVLLGGLVLHDANGDYCAAARRVLRDAHPLPDWP